MNAGGVSKACKSNGCFPVAISGSVSGKREHNTLVIYPEVRYNLSKDGLIPDVIRLHMEPDESRKTPWEEPMSHQLVGRVTAYQGYDE